MVTMLKNQSVNFNFNREINDPRIKKMKIMLPIVKEGTPDFKYMEQYGKNMMLKKYQQYLKYINSSANES